MILLYFTGYEAFSSLYHCWIFFENIQKIASDLEASDIGKRAHCRITAWVSLLNPVPKSLQLSVIISFLHSELGYICAQFQIVHLLANWNKLRTV